LPCGISLVVDLFVDREIHRSPKVGEEEKNLVALDQVADVLDGFSVQSSA
jgi:hypothetical protein